MSDLFHLELHLLIDSGQLFIDGLQFLATGFQLLGGRAQLLVHRLELFIAGFQLFGRRLGLLDNVAKACFDLLQLPFQMANDRLLWSGPVSLSSVQFFHGGETLLEDHEQVTGCDFIRRCHAQIDKTGLPADFGRHRRCFDSVLHVRCSK